MGELTRELRYLGQGHRDPLVIFSTCKNTHKYGMPWNKEAFVHTRGYNISVYQLAHLSPTPTSAPSIHYSDVDEQNLN
jgi:hypothetical protein